MINEVYWKHHGSPFFRGNQEHPLTLTLHTETLKNITSSEFTAIEAIREFGLLQNLISIYETETSIYPHFEIGMPTEDFIPVDMEISPTSKISASIFFPKQWPKVAMGILKQVTPDNTTQELLKLLYLTEAHKAINSDIFVTLSPMLLRYRDTNTFKKSNIRTPIEAIKIIGLFLRSRNVYITRSSKHVKHDISRFGFYLELARHFLPSISKYEDTFRPTNEFQGNVIHELSSSVLIRCTRALQARDAIGILFYSHPNYEIADEMVYHFEYMLLLLAGALDAQALITNYIYKTKQKGQGISFRSNAFLKELGKNGALGLVNSLQSETQNFNTFSKLIFEPRNTIHKEALLTRGLHYENNPQTHIRIHLPNGCAHCVLEGAKSFGGYNYWGLTSIANQVFLEPYTYASNLISKSFEFIDLIASNTTIDRLSPNIDNISKGETKPNQDDFLNYTDRIALLG
jgi:hypothetical protein